jgi:hypothetical protein
MANFYLASPLKGRLVQVIIFIICLIILAHIGLSLFLFRYFHTVLKQVDERLGKIYISAVVFDFLRGITLHDVSVIDNSTPPQILFQAQRLSLGFQPLKIFAKELNFNRIRTSSANFYVDQDSQTFARLIKITDAVYKKFLEHQIVPLDIKFNDPTIIFKLAKIIVADFSTGKEGLWVLRSTGSAQMHDAKMSAQGAFIVEYKIPKASSFVKFFRDQLIKQSFNYKLKTKIINKDLHFESFDIALDYDHITSQGVIKNFSDPKPIVNLIVNSSNLSIENISSLIKDFDTRGSFNVAAVARGPLDNLKFMLTANFLGCSFRYASFPLLRNVVGKMQLTEKGIKFDNLFFIMNDISCKLNAELASVRGSSKVLAELAIKQPAQASAFLPVSISLDFALQNKQPALIGSGNVGYTCVDKTRYSAQFNDVALSRSKDEGMLKVKRVLVLIHEQPAIEGAKQKRLDLSELAAHLDFRGQDFKINNMQLAGFGGRINGDITFFSSPEYRFTSRIYAEGLDAAKIEDSLSLPYNLLGPISSKIFVDSGDDTFCKGALLIKAGKMQETALLLALSDYMNISSLKSIDFDDMQLDFTFLRNGVFRYGIKIRGKTAVLKANMRIGKDKQMAGFFNASLSQGLLTESVQFRKLLKIIGSEASFVDFPFTLGGTIHKPRLSWLRNDFKRSLESVIPAWYRRGMQSDVDDAVAEMFGNAQNN